MLEITETHKKNYNLKKKKKFMKQILIILLAFLSLALARIAERHERLTVEDLPKFMRSLRIFSPECNTHGVYYKSKCFCYSQYDGAKCENKGKIPKNLKKNKF